METTTNTAFRTPVQTSATQKTIEATTMTLGTTAAISGATTSSEKGQFTRKIRNRRTILLFESSRRNIDLRITSY